MSSEKECYNKVAAAYNDLAEKHSGLVAIVKDLIEEIDALHEEMDLQRKCLLDLNQRLSNAVEVPA